MSNYQRWQQPQALRESLSPEEMVKTQIMKCLDAFNENNAEYIHATVEALKNFLLTPDFADDEFFEDIEDLSDAWDKEKRLRQRMLQKAMQSAECSDVVEGPPMQPSTKHFTLMWMACLRVCERKGITWRKKTREDIGPGSSVSPPG